MADLMAMQSHLAMKCACQQVAVAKIRHRHKRYADRANYIIARVSRALFVVLL